MRDLNRNSAQIGEEALAPLALEASVPNLPIKRSLRSLCSLRSLPSLRFHPLPFARPSVPSRAQPSRAKPSEPSQAENRRVDLSRAKPSPAIRPTVPPTGRPALYTLTPDRPLLAATYW